MLKASYSCVVLVMLAGCRGSREPAPAADAAVTPELTPPADAERSSTGLASRLLRRGNGPAHPEPQDLVEVHFTGWGNDGKMFDSSIPRVAPAQFELGATIKGWSEGIALMVAGEKRRLWLPPALAYGDDPQGRVPHGPLVFDIELLKVIKKPRPPAAPPDVAAPPTEAQRTPSGLAYRVIRPGSGAVHPRRGNVVQVNYSGWTPEARLFDSTVIREQPATMQVGAPGTIEGWNEALTHMVVGEKTRFWVPPALGYGKKVVGGPVGPLVFEVELLAIR